jgi:hypothetical protein
VIRFRKHKLARLNRPHKETAKNYFHRVLCAGVAYVLSRWCAGAAAYMAAGAAYALTRLYIGRVIAAYMANRLNSEPLIWCRAYIVSRSYSEPLFTRYRRHVIEQLGHKTAFLR